MKIVIDLVIPLIALIGAAVIGYFEGYEQGLVDKYAYVQVDGKWVRVK